MLHILIILLKIIGSLLVTVIGILLLAIIFVLLVPVRYCIEADGKLGEEEPLWIEIKITWLMHFISAIFSYPENTGLRIKIFGIPVFDSARKKEKKSLKGKKSSEEKKLLKEKKPLKEKKSSKGQKTDQTRSEWKDADIIEENDQTKGSGNDKEDNEAGCPTQEPHPGQNIDPEDNRAANPQTAKRPNPIQKFFAALFCFFRKLLDAIRNIEYTIQELCGKIKGAMENIRYYIEILQGEAFQNAFQNAKSQLFRILKMLKPRKCRANLTIGLDDPAGTGQITAIYGMLYPWIGHHIFLRADFEEKIVEGDLYIKGKVTVIVFLIAALKLYMDKNIRNLLKILKREDA